VLTVDPRELARETVTRVVEQTDLGTAPSGANARDLLRETLYAERRRLERAPDAAAHAFFTRTRRDLERADDAEARALLRAVVGRYVDDIAGHFDRRFHALATQVVPRALGLMLGGAEGAISGGFGADTFASRLVVSGETEALRRVAALGPVLFAGTHASYLDPLVAGWALHRLGLPPFASAAARPLFEHPLIGPFVRRLGCYSVDESKTAAPLYRETLKAYATLVLEHGGGDLVFPGGVRSASGAVEGRPKLGLLGTALPALRTLALRGGPPARVFVVPCTISWPQVLEAETRVERWLEDALGARHVPRGDEFATTRRWFSFMRGLAAADLRIHVVVGRPLDPFGNDVDIEGEGGGSLDPRGRPIEASRYLLAGGALTVDPPRDAEYTRMLAERVAAAWRQGVVPLATHVVAYAVFERLWRDGRARDLTRFLTDVAPDAMVDEAIVEADVAKLLEELHKLAAAGTLQPPVDDEAKVAIARAMRTFATYHERPVLEREEGRLRVGDPSLLAYYRNRLDGYGLLGAPSRVTRASSMGMREVVR
jgi:glycerol-3-phosphate O-acyltransferase